MPLIGTLGFDGRNSTLVEIMFPNRKTPSENFTKVFFLKILSFFFEILLEIPTKSFLDSTSVRNNFLEFPLLSKTSD